MDVIECIKTRRSVRKFLETPVEWDKVGTIIDAGRNAPSAGNLQNWKFTVLLQSEAKKAVAEACLQQYWIATAPVVIVITAEPKKSERFYGVRGERLYAIQNCAAAAQNMLLAAHSLGLGACWVGAFDEDMLKRAIGVKPASGEIRPQSIIAIGYPGEQPPEPAKHPLTTVTFLDGYGNKISDPNVYAEYPSSKVQAAIGKGKAALKKITKKVAKK